jgi:hypothetical protein
MVQADVTLVFSDQRPEPERATWIATELAKQGLSVTRRQYQIGDDLLELLRECQTQARKVVVLFSSTTAQSAGIAFVEFKLRGYQPLPVRCENHSPPPLMADLAHADIFGLEKSKDVAQLTRLVRAIG